jgi:signal transduction histidine kinase/ActR/RegA family two-component response regulator
MTESLRVLLVEDSEEDVDLVTLALKRGGFDVKVTRVDTREAMQEALNSRIFDVIVADYSMPHFTMGEALEMARTVGLDIPFLIVSATILEEEGIRAMRNGAQDFIMKDKLGRLAPAVERELREAVVRRERKILEERVRQNQRMESLGVLAGGVAHDFNNLLVGIMGNSSLMLDMVPSSSPLVPLLSDIVLASQKAADLTRQMLAYAGKGRFVSEPTDLSALVQDIGGLVRTSISRKVQIQLNATTNLPSIEADPTQIQQLIMNLLINGAEAIGDQTGTVIVTTGVRDVDASQLNRYYTAPEIASGQFVFLEVKDNGCGMDESTLSRIFEPFFTTKFTGRGLGLAATLGIVRGHQGALKVESEVGNGSTFEILFPATTRAPLRKREPPPARAPRRNSPGEGHILVVDDEEVVRCTAKSALERYGYTVLLSENGHHAVDVFMRLSGQISLILLDLTMPVMGGEEALRKLRAIRPDVAVILTSGYDEARALEGFRETEVSGFLKKPYTVESLVKLVRSILSSRAANA